MVLQWLFGINILVKIFLQKNAKVNVAIIFMQYYIGAE